MAARTSNFTFTGIVFATAFLLLVSLTAPAHAEPANFSRDVAPILQKRCLSCHNGRKHGGDLSLQSRESTFKGGESGAAVVPGDVDSSYLLDLITPSDGLAEMPKGEPPLDPAEIEILRNWIETGAAWPENSELEVPVLWSLKPIQNPVVPNEVASSLRFSIRNPVDAFIAARHHEANLEVAPQANRRTLVRRLSLDLLGLPPSPEIVESFVADTSPDAYESLVEELLESPHFGEHWGRHWLDLARYADSEGYLGDSERPHAWVYREWVIDAFNEDLPFDQFTIQQLAGDLLDNPTLNQKIATGFHRNTLRNTEAGVDLELYRTQEIVDRVNTTGMVWLGLTLGCAECHDHKNDPISQKEFYQLYAFFNNADDVGVSVTKPWETEEYEQAMQAWEPDWHKLREELKEFETEGLTAEQQTEISKQFDAYRKSADLEKVAVYFKSEEAGWKEMKSRLVASLGKRPVRPSTKARAFVERTKDRRETFVHIRGIYNRPGDKVSLDTPEVLPPLQVRGTTPDRRDLAKWLFDEQNPLTARVAVNRIWQQLFGQGIVASPNDFGNKGAAPSHPLLLDWLATEYRRVGWSRKEMIRRIVLSSTYRLSSSPNSVDGQNDISNQLLWRQNSYRVNAETVRDLHLTVSGLLDRTIGRRGIRPPLPAFVTAVGRSVKWPESQGSERYRRGMYIFFKRTVPYPMLMTFDAPDASLSCSRRERSNTPLQALTLLNSPVFNECAQALGREVIAGSARNPTAAVSEIFLRCLGRVPAELELKYLMAAYNDLMQMNKEQGASAEESELTTMTAMARIVMNLDEFITRD